MSASFLREADLEYLNQRKTLSLPERLAGRRSFTIDEPHTCPHCQKLTIAARNPLVRPYSHYYSHPEYNLRQAIDAARAKCDLFIWLVDLLVEHAKIRHEEINLTDVDETCVFGLLGYVSDGRLDFRPSFLSKSGKGMIDVPSPAPFALAEEADPSAQIVKNRPYELDKASKKSTTFARDSFRTCLASHQNCRSQDRAAPEKHQPESLDLSDAPRRLLNIYRSDGGGLNVRVVETANLGGEKRTKLIENGFVALSYCWGGDQPVKLTKESVAILKNGIASNDLPKTLRDTVWFCNALDLEYLWIDALCIIQDDGNDKQLEIARMETYYGKSVLTICAASAKHCREGLFTPSEFPEHQCGPIRMASKLDGGQRGTIYLAHKLKSKPEPLTTRAWTLQESMLSRRMLVFTTDEIYWSCQTGYAECSGPMIIRGFGAPESLVQGILPITTLYERPVISLWESIVSNYSNRSLGFSSDKLPAVSALASVVREIARGRNEELIYVAGLHIMPKRAISWPQQLSWYTASPEPRRPRPWRAPSWSWASLDSPVNVGGENSRRLDPQTRQGLPAEGFSVESYGFTLQNPRAPFGMVTDAFLSLRARARQLTRFTDTNIIGLPLEVDAKIEQAKINGLSEMEAERPCMRIYPDTNECEKIIRAGFLGQEIVYALEMTDLLPSGLLVHSAPGSNSVYKRVGFFYFPKTIISRAESFSDADLLKFFESQEIKPFRID